MDPHRPVAALGLVGALLCASLVFSQPPPGAGRPAPQLVVRDAWSRATPPGAEVAVGYLVVDNPGAADRLRSVETAAAERAELHTMTMHDGVMRMRPAPGGLPVAAGGRLELAPRGAHIMFIRPTRPFVAGHSVEITLRFERAGARIVRLPIVALGESGPPRASGQPGSDAP